MLRIESAAARMETSIAYISRWQIAVHFPSIQFHSCFALFRLQPSGLHSHSGLSARVRHAPYLRYWLWAMGFGISRLGRGSPAVVPLRGKSSHGHQRRPRSCGAHANGSV